MTDPVSPTTPNLASSGIRSVKRLRRLAIPGIERSPFGATKPKREAGQARAPSPAGPSKTCTCYRPTLGADSLFPEATLDKPTGTSAGQRVLPPGPGQEMPPQVDHRGDQEPDLEGQVADRPHVRRHHADVLGLVGEQV